MKAILTPNAPAPAGHYSQAIVHNGLAFVSGQLPINPALSDRAVGTIEEQTYQVLRNVEEVLKAANSDLTKVLKVTIYIADISLWARVNEVYGRFFGSHKPARCVVPTKDLHYGYQIEVEVIAAVAS